MKTATARKLCGQCEAGWRYDESTDPATVTRCPCMDREASPQQARTAALNETAAAHPRALDAAVRIIRDAAEHHHVLSANTVREALDHADVPGPVRGAAWVRCAAKGWVQAIDRESSTQGATHGKPVATYRSLIARDGAA